MMKKIAVCRSRNAEIDKQIMELENLDIIGLVRNVGLTPEQLAALIQPSCNTVPADREEEHNYV